MPGAKVTKADELADEVRTGLLQVIRDAVSKDGHGLDIVLANQAADVYNKLFGEIR